MKTKALAVVLLISMLLVQNVESIRFRRIFRRIGRGIGRVLKPICRLACPRVCTRFVPLPTGCRFVCSRVCRGKREAIENSHETPLPYYMSFYDLDEDNFVSVEEFIETLGHFGKEQDLFVAFNSTDIDNDGKLTEEELFSSPVLNFGTVSGMSNE